MRLSVVSATTCAAAIAGAAEPSPATSSVPTPNVTEAKKPEVRGPADDLVVEASAGYGVGALSAVGDRSPKVLHGPTFHLGAGWAWTIKANQSLGLLVFADGMFDGDRTTGRGTKLGARYGASAFVAGEKAHVRLGAGYARTTADGQQHDGIGVAFAAGWQFPILPGAKSWKRPYGTFEIVPSWDFLGAGSQTLHRWTFAMQLGFALL